MAIPPLDEIAKIKTEIQLLESALKNCADTTIRELVEDWLKERRAKLAELNLAELSRQTKRKAG
jgi:hypothetical protein